MDHTASVGIRLVLLAVGRVRYRLPQCQDQLAIFDKVHLIVKLSILPYSGAPPQLVEVSLQLFCPVVARTRSQY
jgi:hypothetical protein